MTNMAIEKLEDDDANHEKIPSHILKELAEC